MAGNPCNSEGVAEFMRIVDEMHDVTESLSEFERKFVEDNFERIEKFGDKTRVTETQLDYARRIYERVL